MPRPPDVFGQAVQPRPSRSSWTVAATARASLNPVPGCGSRSIRSRSGRSLSSQPVGLPPGDALLVDLLAAHALRITLEVHGPVLQRAQDAGAGAHEILDEVE